MASSHSGIRRVLSIAGSDSGGGAGIQADLKAFAACGVHGMTAITAITAQNTVGVDAIAPVAPEMILAQVRSVARDIGIDAVKIGMLGTAAATAAVARALDELTERARAQRRAPPPIVLDPVMVSESGAPLLEPDARRALIDELLPLITVLTPNLPEARELALARSDDATAADDATRSDDPTRAGDATRADRATPAEDIDADGLHAAELARAIRALGPAVVVLTGGHRAVATDVFFDGERIVEIPGERHPDGAAHGSGCTHSSVLAARLALGDTPLDAARAARRAAGRAVRDGHRSIGEGPGPVNVLDVGVGSEHDGPESRRA